MSHVGRPDCFEVINGPEDGTEFVITRTPVFIGQDHSCAVNVRLDTSVRPCHARVTVVSDGYRIRSADGAPVYVDGKRAGVIRSRVLRPGGQVQVGSTLLALDCSPDGLASRSRGIVAESDLAWAIQQATTKVFQTGRSILRFAFAMLGRILNHWKFCTIVVLVLLFLLVPQFRIRVQMVFGFLRGYLSHVVNMFQDRAPMDGG